MEENRHHVKHPILHGQYPLKIDGKNRLVVPAEIRKVLDPDRDGKAFFLVIGSNEKPWFYTEKYYEHLVSREQQELMPHEDLLAFDQYHFAMVSRVQWDKQWRILLPESTLKETHIQREVTLVGVRDHLELWNRVEWEAHCRLLRARSREIMARAKQVHQQT